MGYPDRKSRLYIPILAVEALIVVCGHFRLLSAGREFQLCDSAMRKTKAMITEDIRCFPIPRAYREEIAYEDSYGASRIQGGHEGCDIMDLKNVPGRIPVVSVSDGELTNIGWLYLGGYRIGITSDNGIYYYYAHLDSYAAGMRQGRRIKAGELIGFMGDTGEGEEGVSGRFPVHLHFGIYARASDGREESVNSYSFLREIDR